MNSNNHIIYLLYDKYQLRYFSNEVQKNGRKIGSTCNMVMRKKPYLTGHPDKVPLECYYKILNPELYTCYEIDNMIKKEFDEYNLKGSGGIEFYEVNKVTQDVLENYFNKMNIKYEKLFDIIDEDIYTITKKDIEDFVYDIEQHKKYTDKNILLKQYIEKIKEKNIILELIKTNNNIFDYLLNNYNDIDINYLKDNLIDDQIETLLTSIVYYQYNDKGIWNLFCRYGKTRLSCLFCKMQKYKKILILVPSLYLINQTYKTWKTFFNKLNIKKVCSQESTNKIEDINKFYCENEICIFISTYHSSEKLQHLNFDICIYDEAHRTAGAKLQDDQSFFKKQLENNNINNKIFLTATTREYTGGEDDYYTMDDENIYGKIISVVSAKKAKELNRICDYNIITIELTAINIDINIDEFFRENNITDKKQRDNLNALKDKYVMCAVGLYKTMEINNIKHVITFHDLIINCKFFKSICHKICTNYNVNHIDGETPNRLEMINKFELIDKSILCSAKVLQEGVDIPKCDGVIFIDIKTSIIDTIQSLSRCLTKIDDKIGYIMIPYDDKTDLLNDQYTNNLRLMLRNIVEIDDNLKEFFKEILKFDFDNMNVGNNLILEELKLKYQVHVNSKIIKELREISYETYYNAKKLIKNKYTHENDYKMNVINDFIDIKLPVDARIIYKSFGWKSWDDFLGLENEMSIRKIKSIIQKENENRKKKNIAIIDTRDKYEQFVIENKNLELLLELEVEYGNWIKFLLKNYDELVENHYKLDELNEIFKNYKISNKSQYEEKTLIDNKLIKYEYISNGFYNETNIGININDYYYIEKHNIRRF